MLYPKIDQLYRRAESAAEELAENPAYIDRNSPFHADAVSMYNQLVTISLTAEEMLKRYFPAQHGGGDR